MSRELDKEITEKIFGIKVVSNDSLAMFHECYESDVWPFSTDSNAANKIVKKLKDAGYFLVVAMDSTGNYAKFGLSQDMYLEKRSPYPSLAEAICHAALDVMDYKEAA